MPTDGLLQERLAHLERAQRRQQRVMFGLGLALVGTLLVGATGERTLEGHALKLTDDAGHVRVLLSADNGLSLVDAAGAPRAVLGVDREGPGLVLYGANSRAILNVNQDGPALAFTGARGDLRTLLAVVKGDPGLIFYDAAERERLDLVLRGDRPQAALRGSDGTPLWQAPTTP